METNKRPYVVLLLSLDADQATLMQASFERHGPPHTLRPIHSPDELRAYLWRKGAFENEKQSPRPGVVLLACDQDPQPTFNLLGEIKHQSDLRRLVINLLIPEPRQDLLGEAYSLGASACMLSPKTPEEADDFWRRCFLYWDQTHLPHKIVDMGARD